MSDWKDIFRASKAPIQIDDQVCIELGRIVEVELGGHIRVEPKKPRRPKIYWCPAKKSLVFFVGRPDKKRGTKGKFDELVETKDGRKAAKLFEKWSAREPSAARTFEAKMTDRWISTIEPPTRVDYWSDKWGDDAIYTHDLGRKVRAWLRLGTKNPFGPAMWVLRGGRLTVTERGIVG